MLHSDERDRKMTIIGKGRKLPVLRYNPKIRMEILNQSCW